MNKAPAVLPFTIEQVVLKKSSLLLKTQMFNTQTFKLFKMILKLQLSMKVIKSAKLNGLVERTKWSN
jgi:hypothetical protein